MKIVTAAQMIELDCRTVRGAGLSEEELIQRAGRAAAGWIAARFPKSRSILILVGRGNNGADALVVAAQLRRDGYRVKSFRIGKARDIRAFEKALRKTRGRRPPPVVVDGFFGTGLNRPVREPFLFLLNSLHLPNAEVIALDVPSGLDATTGRPRGAAPHARATLTFGLPKSGLVQEHAADHVGELHVLDIGFPSALVRAISSTWDLIAPEDMIRWFVPRKRYAHKGDFGRVVVVGGSTGFAGAPALAARAALRAGAGLVHLLAPERITSLSAALAGAEVMTHPCPDAGHGTWARSALKAVRPFLASADAVVVGPGMGCFPATLEFLGALIAACPAPMVLDAGALNLLAEKPALLRKARCEPILTPHPGEMARLAGCTTAQVQRNRFETAGDWARQRHATVILKGARTVIAHPKMIAVQEGASATVRFSVNALAGTPGMATAGCGDALAGVLGALLARGLSNADAARAAVWLHARAGDLAMPSTGGGLAGDLIEAIPRAMAELSGG